MVCIDFSWKQPAKIQFEASQRGFFLVAQAVFVDFMPGLQTLIPPLANRGRKKSQNLFEFWEYSLACEAFHL
jgi:hypothetical protein